MQCFFDIETDGIGTFRPPNQKLIQLAALIDGTYHVWYSSDVSEVSDTHPFPSLLEKCKTHGIPTRQILTEFYELLQPNTQLVAHNLEFDCGTLLSECKNHRNRKLYELIRNIRMNNKLLCTMRNSIEFCGIPFVNKYDSSTIRYKFPKLSELANKFDIEVDEEKVHNAIYDVELLHACYLKGGEVGLW